MVERAPIPNKRGDNGRQDGATKHVDPHKWLLKMDERCEDNENGEPQNQNGQQELDGDDGETPDKKTARQKQGPVFVCSLNHTVSILWCHCSCQCLIDHSL